MRYRILFHITFFVLMFCISVSAYAQLSNIRTELSDNMKRADKCYNEKSYTNAALLYKRVIIKDSANINAKLRLAESLRLLNKMQEAEYWFSTVLGKGADTAVASIYKLHYAEVLLSNGKIEEASKWFTIYNKENASDKRNAKGKESVDFYQRFYQDSMQYTIRDLSFNSEASDFSPVFYGKGIVFSSSRKKDNLIKYVNATDDSYFLGLYYTEFMSDSSFTVPIAFEDYSNALHEGPITFFEHDTKAIFSKNLKGSSKSDGVTRLGLYCATKSSDGSKWFAIEPFPFNNQDYSLSHPYFDKNTNTLYFVSDMPGGIGETDIYKSEFKDGKWTNPVNLGPAVNTSGNEMFPFVSKDSCLYFASNGYPGMGGLDLFKADLNDQVIIPENMGYPVNSSKDDFSFILADNMSTGYFSSNRKNGGTDDDIYEVKIYSTKLDGVVLDKLKMTPVKDGIVKITDIEADKVVYNSETDGKGAFKCFIKPGKHYQIKVIKNDFKIETSEVYASSRDVKNISSTIVLEKANKNFVKGSVLIDSVFLSGCIVKVMDLYADTIETLVTDSTGHFQCEVNADTTNIFYAENDTLRGIFKTEPTKKSRRGSGITYINIDMGNILTKNIQGVYLDKEGSSIAGDTLYFRNELNDEILPVACGNDGKFSAELWLYGRYSACVKRNEKFHPVVIFIPDRIDILELRKPDF